MTTQETNISQQPSGGILGWFGIRKPSEEEPAGDHPIRQDLVAQARQDLIGSISAFLIDNGLEITVQNLATAHGIYSGLNPGLKRRVERLHEEKQGITQAWLDMATATDCKSDDKAVEELANHLEQGIADFTRTTKTARDATSEYGDALEQHVGILASTPGASELVSDLAEYAQAMLERSRKAEAELQQSEEEAASLRRNLDRARRDAEVDFLTGLPNRRAFEAVLDTHYREAKTAVEALSVAFCDIDHFKAVNDTHGHDAGDRIICVVAKTLAGISDDNCHIARHGGEEFVMLFRGAGMEEAQLRLDQAREELAGRKLMNRRTQQPFGQVTFSGGIANVFAYENPRDALAAADEALYQAKEGGRNQIRLAK